MKKHAFSVIGLFLLLYIVPLEWRPLAIPDETRYAEIPREMIVSGDWVVPRLNGLRYFEKPALGYWLNAFSIRVFGENAFAIRLTSALSAGMTALILFFLLRRFGGGPEVGILGAAAYLTSLLVLALGVISTLDSMLTLFLTGAMVFFFLAYREDHPSRRVAFLALFGALCGAAFLIKGFLAFAVPFIAIVPFLIWEGRLRELIRISCVPFLTLVLVTAPWCILIHFREGDFWRYFFWVEHINRFFSPIPGQHPKPFWYFLPILAGGALPWIWLFPPALSPIRAQTVRRDPLVRFAICWFLFPFLFFSACSGKLVPYILPCLPPLLILITVGLALYFQQGKRRGFDRCAISLGGIMGAIAAALALSQTLPFPGNTVYDPKENWKWALAGIGLLAWGGCAIASAMSSDWRKKLSLYVVAPLPLLFLAHFVLPNHVLEERAPGDILMRNQNKICEDTMIVTNDHLVPAVSWFFRRIDIHLLETAGELRYGLSRDDSHPPRLMTLSDLINVIKSPSGKGGTVLFLKGKNYLRVKKDLPEPKFRDSDNGFVFLKF